MPWSSHSNPILEEPAIFCGRVRFVCLDPPERAFARRNGGNRAKVNIDLFLHGSTPVDGLLHLARGYITMPRRIDAIDSRREITPEQKTPVVGVLRLYVSPAEVPIGFDVDSSASSDGEAKDAVMAESLGSASVMVDLLIIDRTKKNAGRCVFQLGSTWNMVETLKSDVRRANLTSDC